MFSRLNAIFFFFFTIPSEIEVLVGYLSVFRVLLGFFGPPKLSLCFLFINSSVHLFCLGFCRLSSGVLEFSTPYLPRDLVRVSIHSLGLPSVPLSAPQQLEGGAGGGAAALSKFIE